MNLMGDHDRETARRAAREAVREARLEAGRPWWQRRFFAWLYAAPARFCRSLKWWGREVGEGAYEVLLAWAVLGFLFLAGLLAWWIWRTVF
jgi:hypothetical protein